MGNGANAGNGANTSCNLALTVTYESAFGEVNITADDVKRYLIRGGGNVTDQEIKLFMELCKYQKLNPFVGEAYPIKFGNDFQMVVGYDAYKRRAEENPAYSGRKSGIVVLRGEAVVQKEGTCLYPGEELIGGWCRVYRERNGKTKEDYKEVGFKEYDKGQANWKSKPCTMIEKVAVSQALRAAFPNDYAGIYTEEEAGPGGEGNAVIDAEYKEIETINQEQRQQLFAKAKEKFGTVFADTLKGIITEYGLESTNAMPVTTWEAVIKRIDEWEEVPAYEEGDTADPH